MHIGKPKSKMHIGRTYKNEGAPWTAARLKRAFLPSERCR